jgi:hypothetical protein
VVDQSDARGLAMTQYIAWLNGTSVQRGTIEECMSVAQAIFDSKAWRDTVTAHGRKTVLRITKGARQMLVSERVMGAGHTDEQGSAKCDKCGMVLACDPTAAGCSHASCGGMFIAEA